MSDVDPADLAQRRRITIDPSRSLGHLSTVSKYFTSIVDMSMEILFLLQRFNILTDCLLFRSVPCCLALQLQQRRQQLPKSASGP